MQDASAQPPEDMPAGPLRKDPSGSAHSRTYLVIHCFMVAVTSALQHRADVLGLPQSLLATLLQYGNGLVTLMWMRADARLRGASIPGGGLLLAAVLLPLAVPAYILWTRRWRGLLVIAVSLLAILVAAIVGQSSARLALGLPIVSG
jgi:hypothetical protein